MSECMTQEDAERMDASQAVQILKPLRTMMLDRYGCPISEVYFALGKAIEALEQPTVDAVPVIHAKWVQNPYSDEPPTCSHCGFESSYYYDRSKSVIENRNGVLLSEAKSKYCPNCGAKMDGADGERRSDEDQHIYD